MPPWPISQRMWYSPSCSSRVGGGEGSRPSIELVWSSAPGLSPSITSSAGKNSRICSAHWGNRLAYSEGEGSSPRRRRSRKSSASRSSGSRSEEDVSVAIEEPLSGDEKDTTAERWLELAIKKP